MTKRMEAAFDGLRAAIFEMYAALEERGSGPGTEHERRENALQSIDEIVEWRPLASFSAASSVEKARICAVLLRRNERP